MGGGISDGDFADDSEFTANGEADSDANFDSDQVEEEPALEVAAAPSRRYRSAPALSTRAVERVVPEPAAPRYRTRSAQIPTSTAPRLSIHTPSAKFMCGISMGAV